VFNASGTVLRAIFSIVNQTYSNLEIIIVDDGSNDDSLSVVKTVADCRLVIIALAENTRKIGAVNEALKCCKGDFITFQDADDFSYPERIQKQVDALLCSVNIGLCFTGYDFSGRNGDFLKLNSSDEEIRNEICFGGFLNHGQTYPTVCATMMFKRDLLSRVDGYRDFMIGRMGEDILLCSELMSYTEAMTIGDVLYYYDMGSANSFTDLFSKNKNPRLNSSFYLLITPRTSNSISSR
jgi:glycosyltransferase involved in cell wall biosynthesis